MPSQGLSLVGFMEQDPAITYLLTNCIPTNTDLPALLAEWATAQNQLGPPFANAGYPTVTPIPQAHAAHVQACQNAAWLAPHLQAGWDFRLIDSLELLLAFQVHFDLDRSNALCGNLPPNPSLADALPLSLPINPPPPPPLFGSANSADPPSILVKSPSLDFQISNKLLFPPGNPGLIGIQIDMSPAFVQVVRFNGRYYLRNGYHRACGLLSRNFQQLPCLYREANNFREVAAGPPGTFGQALLESANPPTLGHFTAQRAYAVTLRRFSRVIHVGWEQYSVPEE